MTTPPQPPKLTIVPPPAPAVLSWNHNPPPPARYIYGRIIAVCVDCGEETWWLQYPSCSKLKKNTVGDPKGPFSVDDPAEVDIYNWFQYGTGHSGDGDGDGLACE